MEIITQEVIVISNYWIIGFGAFIGLLAVAISGQ